MTDSDFCEHDSSPDTCNVCSGQHKSTAGRSGPRGAGSQSVLDSPAALEKYRRRYLPDRESTFEAYVEVFFRLSGAGNFPGGWITFSRSANAEPALVGDERGLVERAEGLMRLAGYELDDSGLPDRGRTWHPTGAVQ